MRKFLVVVLLAACASSAFAQTPYLVKDLGNFGTPEPSSSEPQVFLASGDKLFFTAATEGSGYEPWVHDSHGTRLLRDINAGPETSGIKTFAELTPGIVIFAADDSNGTQLWRSDGTEAGTTLLKIVNAIVNAPDPRFTAAFGDSGKVFFSVDDGVHGREPWVTDGTAAGTQLLVDAAPGAAGSCAVGFFRFGNGTRFFAAGGIWTTDGTPGGTTLDIPIEKFAMPIAVTSTAVFFFGYDAAHGWEPWKSDGTVTGTSMIKDVRSGPSGSVGSVEIAPTASGAVFYAYDGNYEGFSTSNRLWTTDGTAANTFKLEGVPGAPLGVYPPTLYPTSKGVFLSTQAKIWRTDGTQAGSYVAASMYDAQKFIDAFSKIYFVGWSAEADHLFQFDGSANATPTSVRSDVSLSDLTFTGGKLWFAGKDATNGSELWTSDDGTTDGTRLVANLAPEPRRSSVPVNLTPIGRYLYFHPSMPQELWRSDGTNGGTIEVTDVNNTLTYPPPFRAITSYRGDIYYIGADRALYRVDGVNGGATKVIPFSSDFNPVDAMTSDENYLYIWRQGYSEKWRSDGTAAGTFQLDDPTQAGSCDSVTVLTYGGTTWIRCFKGLLRTAGTLETTRRVAALPQNSSLYGEFVGAGGLLYSPIRTQVNGLELWRSDGTPGGSFMVKDASPGAGDSNPSQLTAAGQLLFYTATDPDHGTELWRSDGTAAGTFMVKDIRPGTASSAPSSLAAIDGIVYFAANDGTSGIELWKSDGTESGTVLVRDIAPGSFSSKPSWLAAADGKIWFSANDGLHGYELWSSDGTEGGTFLAGDIVPGSSSSSPDQLTAVESSLFFTARTEAEGRELWALPLTTGSVSVAGTRTTEGDSGTRAMRFTITRHGASSGAASVAYATLPGTASAGVDYLTASGTISFAGGETVKTADVTINGDTATEGNESLFLQLSSPAGVALQNAVAAGVIDDDDPRADLSAEVLQNAYSMAGVTPRVVKVTNNGPSIAYNVIVTFTESPYEFTVLEKSGVSCTTTMPAQCTIAALQPGASRTLTIDHSESKGLVDPAMPPGRTVTVSVASSVTDPDPTNNLASRMMSDNGMLLLPPALTIGTSALTTFDVGGPVALATDVTLTSSAGNVVVSPATVRIEYHQSMATFTLTTSAGAGKTLLTATSDDGRRAALAAPIFANGESPLLDVAIVANNKTTYTYFEPFTIPVVVAARTHDGTRPSGLVTLLDENGTTLSQLTLDSGGAATFTRPQLPPGEYRYRIAYAGDARFNALTVSLPVITIQKVTPTVTIYAPTMSCTNPVEVRVVVSGPAGAPAPTGTVTFSRSASGTYTLAPNGVAGQSEFTAAIAVELSDFRRLSAGYSGDTIFATRSATESFSNGCAMSLVATATSPTSVALSWSPPTPASWSYLVTRASSINGPYVNITGTYDQWAVDSTAQAGQIYFYVVYAFPGYDGAFYTSNVDIASTFTYTDSPLAGGVLIKSAHLTELRTMVAALRAAAGQPPLTFTGSVAAGNIIDARHITELRDSINSSRTRIGVAPISWATPNAASGAVIRATTLQELRGAAN